ncbi:MAG: hypothetical protein ABIH50_06655 [bacterium]
MTNANGNMLGFSPIINPSFISGNRIDVKQAVNGFWDEMSALLAGYAELSLNPDPEKMLQVGSVFLPGDQLNSTTAALVIEDRLQKIGQAQTQIIDILSKQFKFDEQLNSLFN